LFAKGPKFPTTRYQGSKRKSVDWIWELLSKINFETALDAFGGTGCISYKLKQVGKSVTYNDSLNFNYQIGKAILENKDTFLTDEDISFVLSRDHDFDYPDFIEANFEDIYFTREENKWLDLVTANIHRIENEYKKAIAFFGVFQSCIAKRPYNLFHRKNLYVRLADVKRGFGNKATWEKPFEQHFRKFVEEANAAVFDNGKENWAINFDVFDVEGSYDLVYIDTPYISEEGVGVNYREFYHFLEGITDYYKWEERIDRSRKHRCFKKEYNVWTDKYAIHDAFEKLIRKFSSSKLIISYRSNGIPSVEQLNEILGTQKSSMVYASNTQHNYVLSKKRNYEVLVIGT